jgi:hypothetical protein
LQTQVSDLKDTVTAPDRTLPTLGISQMPTMVNLADNTDFIYSDENYNSTAYTDDEDVLANWYGRLQATASAYTENAVGAESTESIRRSAHGSGARAGVEWDDSTGAVLLTGGYRLSGRLQSKISTAGAYIAIRMNLMQRDLSFSVDTATGVHTATDRIDRTAHNMADGTRVRLAASSGGTLPVGTGIAAATDLYIKSGTANDFQLALTSGGAAIDITAIGSGTFTVTPQISTDMKLKVSIWDNTDLRILRGTKPALTATKSGAHAGGTVTRQYILEVVLPSGRSFYTDVASFTTGANQATNTVATTSVSSTNFVTVGWGEIQGQARYRLYRRTPSEADTNWYLVETITNGSTTAKDFGGTGGGVWAVPAFDAENSEYQEAVAYLDDVETTISTIGAVGTVAVAVQSPTLLTPNGNQFIQIEFVKADYSATTVSDIPNDSMYIDRVGVCFTNGRWAPSPRDQALAPAPTGNPAPPPSTGGDGGTPPAGGGVDYCVEETTPILVWNPSGNHYYLPANGIVQGDKLVSWDGEKLAPTKVRKVIKGLSRSNYIIHSQGHQLICSFSHRLVTGFGDFHYGTRVNLELKETLRLTDTVELSKVDAVELIDETCKVITFELDRGRRNFIADGFVSHNRKADPDPSGF